MKRLYSKLFLVVLISVFIISCTSTYYQVQTTSPGDNIKEEKGYYVFENEDCVIFYDFWGENGNSSYIFKNKTDKYITINLDSCFLIQNGRAVPYYNDREYQSSTIVDNIMTSAYQYTKGYGIKARFVEDNPFLNTVRRSISAYEVGDDIKQNKHIVSGVSLTQKELKKLIVPAKSYICVDGIRISSRYRDCAFNETPNMQSYNRMTFTKRDTPLAFANMVNYTVEGIEKTITVSNEFYISEVVNYAEKSIIKEETYRDCYTKKIALRKVFSLKEYYKSLYIPYKSNLNKKGIQDESLIDPIYRK